MTRSLVPFLSAIGVAAVLSCCGPAAAQQPSADVPEPKMPPMPSMEGQQGDVSKPITQIPARKKTAEKPAKETSKPPAAKSSKPKAAASRAHGRHRRH